MSRRGVFTFGGYPDPEPPPPLPLVIMSSFGYPDVFAVQKKLYKLSKSGGGNLNKIQKNSSIFSGCHPWESAIQIYSLERLRGCSAAPFVSRMGTISSKDEIFIEMWPNFVITVRQQCLIKADWFAYESIWRFPHRWEGQQGRAKCVW